MKLAITDANIFIDLIHTELIEHLFCINCEIHTCLEVMEELNEKQQCVLAAYQEKGLLIVHRLTADEQLKADAMEVPSALSATDMTVIFLAKKLEASVLTGDGPLRKHCTKLAFEVHGILWLFDCFFERKFVAIEECILKLEKLMAYNDRLPRAECEKRFLQWKSSL